MSADYDGGSGASYCKAELETLIRSHGGEVTDQLAQQGGASKVYAIYDR